MRVALAAIGVAIGLAAGCAGPGIPRERVTLAIVAGVYYSADPGVRVDAAMVEDSETLLKKTVADLNAMKNVDFVVVGGDLLARADPVSLDRAKAMLSELKMPYSVVLGEHDGPVPPAKAAEGEAAAAAGVSRSTIIWAFQGHGFSTAEGYWVQEVLPGLVLVGLDTVAPAAGTCRRSNSPGWNGRLPRRRARLLSWRAITASCRSILSTRGRPGLTWSSTTPPLCGKSWSDTPTS